jgi:hypothetical protein
VKGQEAQARTMAPARQARPLASQGLFKSGVFAPMGETDLLRPRPSAAARHEILHDHAAHPADQSWRLSDCRVTSMGLSITMVILPEWIRERALGHDLEPVIEMGTMGTLLEGQWNMPC